MRKKLKKFEEGRSEVIVIEADLLKSLTRAKRNRSVSNHKAPPKKKANPREYIKQSNDKVQMQCDPSRPPTKTSHESREIHTQKCQLMHRQTQALKASSEPRRNPRKTHLRQQRISQPKDGKRDHQLAPCQWQA